MRYGFARTPDPAQCELCNRKALYRVATPSGVPVGACKVHRSLAVAAMTTWMERWDARYHAARSALKKAPLVERGYNVGRKGQA